MNYTYRHSNIADLDQIMQVFVEAQAFMEAHGNPQWPKGFPDRNDVKYGIFGGLLYCVTVENEIAAVFAVAGYDRDYDEIEGKWLTSNQYLAVHRVAVRDKYRGKGAAKFIVDTAAVRLAKERGRTSIRMDTHEKNEPMQSLLLSHGFTKCGMVRLLRDDSTRLAYEKEIG